MDDMSGILARDFGIRPQGMAAPMAASKTASTHRSTSSSSTWTGNASPSYDDFFNPTAPSATANSKSTVNQPHDPILDTFNKGPVFDTPVYDDDIFDGVPGVKSSSTMRFDDVFGSGPSDRSHVDSPPTYDDLLGSLGSASGRVDRSHAASPPPYDDFLGGLGTGGRKDDKVQGSVKTKGPDLSGFDDLLPGFGSNVRPPQPKREAHETDLPKPPKAAPSVQDDPFSVFETVTSTPSVPSTGLFSDPLDEFAASASASGPTKVDSSPTADNLFSENRNSFESGSNHDGREKSADLNGSFREKDNPKIIARDTSPMGSFHKKGTNKRSPLDDFEMPRSHAGHRSMGSDSFSRNKRLVEDQSPDSSENSETGEDIWLTVSEIPLFTRPTSGPPPSRPPPPLTIKPKSRQNYSFNNDSSSPVDDLEDFATGKPHPQKFEFDEGGEMERSSAAMKDAMNKAEAKFRHAKGVREKMRSKEAEQQERDDADREIAEKEREERDREERERRRITREEEEKRRKEKEERDKARLAVERATREARERAATEAKLRAERAAVQRAQQEARERASVDARERAAADREAREKAAAEAAMEREREREREREAREKAAAERLEREKAEAEKDKQRRDQRAAVERAAAEARERLAQAAKERHQQKSQAQQRRPDPVQQRRPDPPQQQPQRAPEDDLESFFGSRANSAPRPARPPPAAESLFETQTPSRNPFDTSRRAASVSGASIPKPPSSVNMMDDLSAIFGGPSSSGGEFQEIDGESEERRKARWDREQRTKERAQKALQEKNERDMQVQREQAERDRIGESLDFEIKRWAAGKEGNLRALLSSMHYILWQECGWQPVSMSDLITAAAVKKVYRKATLCIHPDKVQQKGATLQQKYIAEKVFDILKEAWNKFNSEELF